ncbi:hypothetical protein ACHAPU_002338 [Fusarium lateritium]
MVTSFLYGKNFLQDIQIFFDYRGLPSEIKESLFNDRFGKNAGNGIKFDEVLMFARFPNVRVIREKGRKAPELSKYCWQDMEFFFNWLYTKGVRRILKVEVDESSSKPHSDQSILKSLERIVLERACKQQVLMFCSSSDQISDTDHYPSSFRRHRFFLIGAAHDDGSAYGHAGKNNDFIFPGVNVDTSGGRSLHLYLADRTAASEESTGSSIATALAAGLAAMITYCFKASALATVIARMQQGRDYMVRPELVKQVDVDRIAEHDVLKGAFNRIGKLENGQFIQVWDRFQPATEYLKDELKSD